MPKPSALHPATFSRVTLRPGVDAPTAARAEVRRVLDAAELPPGRIEDVALVAGLLVGESVRTAHTTLSMVVRRHSCCVSVSVEDGGAALPVAHPERTGYGMDLVDRLARSWGFLRTAAGRRVWARVAIDRAGAAAHASACVHADSSIWAGESRAAV